MRMRMFPLVKLCLSSILAVLPGLAANGQAVNPALYAVTENGDFGTLDPITGTFFKIGGASYGIAGLGFAANGRLYGVIPTNTFFPTFAFGLGLYSINTNTGANTIIGAGAQDPNADTGSLAGYGMTSAADGTLYAYIDLFDGQTPGPASLYRVSPANGALTYVGSMGIPTAGGFASDESGNLFITGGPGPDQLYSVNSSTGAATLIGPTGCPTSFALAFFQNTLYLVDFMGGIWTVDTATGLATKVSTFTSQSVYGMVNTMVSRYVPAPGPPVIQQQPTNETVLAWNAANFSVVASGTGPFAYQWRINGANLTNVLASRSTLFLSGTSSRMAGNYDVVVASPFGSVTSSVVSLTLTLPRLESSVGIGGALSLQMSGLPGGMYILQSATNLVAPVNWQPVYTNAADTNGNWSFTNSSPTASPVVFFRVSAH